MKVKDVLQEPCSWIPQVVMMRPSDTCCKLLLLVLLTSIRAQTDGDDQFREAILDSLKQFYEKANVLELKVDQLNNEMKTAKEKIASLESERGGRPNSEKISSPVTENFTTSAPSTEKICPSRIGSSLSHCSALTPNGCHCAVLSTKTLEAAKAYCNTYGMQLVSIESVDEQLRIAYFLTKLKSFYLSLFWTSGTYDAVEGQWMWSSTGNAVTYNNWAIGQSFYSSSDANQLTIGRIIPFLWYAEAAADSSGNPVKKFSICEF